MKSSTREISYYTDSRLLFVRKQIFLIFVVCQWEEMNLVFLGNEDPFVLQYHFELLLFSSQIILPILNVGIISQRSLAYLVLDLLESFFVIL